MQIAQIPVIHALLLLVPIFFFFRSVLRKQKILDLEGKSDGQVTTLGAFRWYLLSCFTAFLLPLFDAASELDLFSASTAFTWYFAIFIWVISFFWALGTRGSPGEDPKIDRRYTKSRDRVPGTGKPATPAMTNNGTINRSLFILTIPILVLGTPVVLSALLDLVRVWGL